MEEAGHAGVTQMQAASATLRAVEGNMTNNIRAAEKFISTIPGVGIALRAAFPIVGAIAFAGVIEGLSEKITKLQNAPQRLSNSFREMKSGR